MSRWLRGLRVAVRLEATTWLRTREVHLYLLLPSLLMMPLIGVFTTAVISLETGPTVAVPTALPPGLELALYLEEEDLTVVPSADPWEEWRAGRVDAALLSVRTAAGVANARRKTEPWASRSRYLVRALADDPGTRSRIEEAVRLAGDDALHGWVALAGGDPDGAWLAKVRRVTLDDPDEADEDDERDAGLVDLVHSWAVKYLLGGVLLLGALVLPVQCVADRRAGVLEALAATATPFSAFLAARLLVFSGLQLAAVGGFVLSGWLLVGGIGPAPGPWLLLDLAEIATGLWVGNALLLLPGLAATDAKGAMNWGSMAVFPLHGVLIAGALNVEVVGVPLASVGVQGAALPRLLGAIGAAVLAGLLITGWSAWFRGDRLLPPDGGTG